MNNNDQASVPILDNGQICSINLSSSFYGFLVVFSSGVGCIGFSPLSPDLLAGIPHTRPCPEDDWSTLLHISTGRQASRASPEGAIDQLIEVRQISNICFGRTHIRDLASGDPTDLYLLGKHTGP